MREVFELSDEQAHRLLEQPSRASLLDSGRAHACDAVCGQRRGGRASPASRRMRARRQLGRDGSRGRDRGARGVPRTRRRRRSDRRARLTIVCRSGCRLGRRQLLPRLRGGRARTGELDAKVMSDIPKNVSDELARLVELRRSIGTLRRALAPHREVIVALAHPELDLLSTETSAERFAASRAGSRRRWSRRERQRSRRVARSTSSSPESDSGRTTS